MLNDRNSGRLYIQHTSTPWSLAATPPEPVDPTAPPAVSSTSGYTYTDELGSVGAGDMAVLEAASDAWWEAESILVDDLSHVMLYVRGDACYQCGLQESCGIANLKVAAALSSNPTHHVQIDTSPQYIEPELFGSGLSGATGHLQLKTSDNDRTDNCGSYTIWMIPFPRWD